MNTINIYLTKEERKQVDIIKQKYMLSLTTICDILSFETLKAWIHGTEKDNRLYTQFLYENGKKTKTSIKKPKSEFLLQQLIVNGEKIKMSRLYTNSIKIYLRKEIKKYIKNADVLQEYHNKVNSKFTTTKDEFYNYNSFVRYQRRNLRENKEYYKNEIAKMESK